MYVSNSTKFCNIGIRFRKTEYFNNSFLRESMCRNRVILILLLLKIPVNYYQNTLNHFALEREALRPAERNIGLQIFYHRK